MIQLVLGQQPLLRNRSQLFSVNGDIRRIFYLYHRLIGSVNFHILNVELCHFIHYNTLFSTCNHHILDGNILNRHFGKSVQISCPSCSPAKHIRDIDVSESRRLLTHTRNRFTGSTFDRLIQVGNQSIIRNINHIYIIDINILHNTTASTGTFKP